MVKNNLRSENHDFFHDFVLSIQKEEDFQHISIHKALPILNKVEMSLAHRDYRTVIKKSFPGYFRLDFFIYVEIFEKLQK